jgi:hypothetical protein
LIVVGALPIVQTASRKPPGRAACNPMATIGVPNSPRGHLPVKTRGLAVKSRS